MADSMQNLDLGFPELTDGKNTEDKLIEIRDYLFILLENLRFLLHNLGLENFNSAELNALTAPVYKSISDLEGNLTVLAVTAEGLGARVSDVEGDVTTVAITALGASIMAQNAAGQAQAVALTVDGFTVVDPNTGKKTLISGDYIKSGTIEGATLVSLDSLHNMVVIGDGAVQIGQSAYGGTLKYDGSAVSLAAVLSALKLSSLLNVSIDAGSGSGVYIGTSNPSERVTIGNGSTEIRLVGDVYINGVKQ